MTVRVFFNSLADAVEALLIVLNDARTSAHAYSFGSLSAKQVLASGLILSGEVEEVLSKLDDAGLAHYELD